MTRAGILRSRASYCDILDIADVAADLRELADVHESMSAALAPDSETTAEELVAELWAIIDPGSARVGRLT